MFTGIIDTKLVLTHAFVVCIYNYVSKEAAILQIVLSANRRQAFKYVIMIVCI